MKRFWVWVCVGLFLVIGVIVAWLEPTQTIRGFFAGDAFYRGRPTRYWRKVLRVEGRSSNISSATAAQFRETQEAFPVLRACASDPEWSVRGAAVALLGQGNARSEEILAVLVGALDDANGDVCLKAIRALDQWGPMARPAVPALAKLLKDPEIKIARSADIALWDIDPSAAVKECGWKPFRSSEWKFTAMLPAEPERTQQTFIFLDIHLFISEHKFGPHTGDTAYGIAVMECPAEWLDGKRKDDILAKARDNLVEKSRGKLVGEQAVEQNGWKGIEFRIEVEGERTRFLRRARLFWVNNRLFQLYVSGVPQSLNVRAADYFMESFQPDKTERKEVLPSGSPHPQRNQPHK